MKKKAQAKRLSRLPKKALKKKKAKGIAENVAAGEPAEAAATTEADMVPDEAAEAEAAEVLEQQKLVSDLVANDDSSEQGLDSDDEELKKERWEEKKGRLERHSREGKGYTEFHSVVEHVMEMYQPC